MFLPIQMVIQNESMIYAPEDVILTLDRWLLKKYPNFTTPNPALTKLECMGVLKSFHDAGKFHLSLKPSEIDKAVNAFLEDRLWVDAASFTGNELLPNQRPEAWMARPNVFVVLGAIPRVLFEAVQVLFGLLRATSVYTFYSFRKERVLKIPKSPANGRKSASISLIKKDS